MLVALLLASVAGCYTAVEGPDVASGIELKADGRFRYMLAAGALDERAEGHWSWNGGRLSLRTEPAPKPATFALKTSGPAPDGVLTLRVVWPDGSGIPGVDLVVGLDDGRTVEGYTQDDGWSLPDGERQAPRWVEFAVTMHGLRSQRFALDGRPAMLTYQLTPNDLGVVIFDGLPIDVTADGLVVHRGEGTIRYRRARC